MEDFEYTNKLEGGLRHLRIQNADEVAKYSVPVETVARPNHNQTGKKIEVLMNAYPITKFPTRNVYQYDVSISWYRTKAITGAAPFNKPKVQIGNGVEKNAVIKKVWNCNARKAALKQIVFDGQKLAWYVLTPTCPLSNH